MLMGLKPAAVTGFRTFGSAFKIAFFHMFGNYDNCIERLIINVSVGSITSMHSFNILMHI
jgi:hypothetical protein